MKPVVYFAHGKESGPWGSKIQALAAVARERGLRVESPDYRGIADPDERIGKLLALAEPGESPLVLVGSSMGGYVSTVASGHLRPAGLFLMAPAFYLPGYAEQDPTPGTRLTVIVHGWNDEVVSAGNVIRFACTNRAELHLLDSDHRLTGRIGEVRNLFRHFLSRLF